MYVYTKSEIRLKNLLRFSILLNDVEAMQRSSEYPSRDISFSDVKLSGSSPCYIKEKYDAYIGFEPIITEEKLLLFDRFKSGTIDAWIKNWGKPTDDMKMILYYLTNVKPLFLDAMVLQFEEAIGKFENIKMDLGPKLHALVEMKVVDKITSHNNDFWRKFIVEDKIEEII